MKYFKKNKMYLIVKQYLEFSKSLDQLTIINLNDNIQYIIISNDNF